MPEAAAELRLSTKVSALPGVGKAKAQSLRRLDVETVSDLLRHLPARYEHEAAEDTVAALRDETIGSARGTIVASNWVPAPGGWARGKKGRFQAVLEDPTGKLHLVWFNASWMREKLPPGSQVRVQGKVKRFNGYPQMVSPTIEPLDAVAEAPTKDERLRPVYPSTEGAPSSFIESLVADALPRVLPQVSDPLPEETLRRNALPPLAEALRMAHQPATRDEADAARRRLAYNELFLLQTGIALKRAYVRRELVAPALRFSEAIDAHIRSRFPFKLTESQELVVKELVADLTTDKPMNRLLQGDVGAGKTIVALYAMLLAAADRKQAALMAPTEILAEQHFASISSILEGSNVRVALLTAGQAGAGTAERAALEAAVERGDIDIVIGTQALLSKNLQFHDLAVVVIDEQHRFGVVQRAGFKVKPAGPGSRVPRPEPAAASDSGLGTRDSGLAGRRPTPHHLVMTATPIPRTLSLTVFGDLDVSTIRGLPPGRTPVANRVVHPEKSDDVYRYLRTRIERGEQAYVVLPVIDEQTGESARKLNSVREHVKLLQDKYLDGFRVAAVHGELKRDTRESVMDRFRRGVVHVLVATTVIEVGVDVPNASVMIIEHAERFGLAQLHQLRGRVGRGTSGVRSLCVFIADPTTEDARKRMDAIAGTNDGFKIAELDLDIRGMGDFFGTRQHGMPPLRVARIPEDMELLQLARREAQLVIDEDADLSQEPHLPLRKVLLREYGEALGLVDIG